MNDLKKKFNDFLDMIIKRGPAVGIFLGLLPAAFCFYAGYTLFIEPGILENDSLEKQVVALEAEVAKGKAVEANEKEFKLEFTKTVELFYESLPLLPKESELSNVLMGIQSVAGRYDVTLTGLEAVKPGVKTPNADKLYEREIPATVVGNYDDVMRFFLDLSRQTRIMIVRDYDVQSATENQKGARPKFVTVNFSLLAYHAPPTQEFPNLPSDIKPALPLDIKYQNTSATSDIQEETSNVK